MAKKFKSKQWYRQKVEDLEFKLSEANRKLEKAHTEVESLKKLTQLAEVAEAAAKAEARAKQAHLNRVKEALFPGSKVSEDKLYGTGVAKTLGVPITPFGVGGGSGAAPLGAYTINKAKSAFD